ncbi:hypothetical protein [Bacillus toyonensis]|uniref:hypothetical protein n=1 Tax=Bacillus toyonensis TaxID=155322 RepID=UPI0001A06F0F|nr:hypothetical protein bcere0017_22700 [Bacillus cereus Rock1-3]
MYAIEISLEGEPVLNLCKYTFINMESVPINEKVSEKYLEIQDVVWKEIDLISITSSNIKEVVFEELQSL